MKNFLTELIRIPSHSGDERDIANYIAQEFKKHTKNHKIVIQKYSKNGRNVLILAKNPKLIIDVHLDTVSQGDVSKWNRNPFELYDDSKNFYGLGVVDVKANIALCLDLVKETNCSNVSFAFCGGEETESLGLRHTLQTNLLDKTARVIVIEPTNLKFFSKHKGCCGVTIKFMGNGKSHSTVSKRKNVVEQALSYLQTFKEAFVKFAKKIDGHSTTYSITGINSEGSKNSSPDACEVHIDFRTVQTQNDTDIIQFLKSLAKETKISISLDHRHFPSLNNKEPFCKTESGMLTFWSHAGLYEQSGFQTVVFGPGNIKYAHS